jgi:hypothetical protein
MVASSLIVARGALQRARAASVVAKAAVVSTRSSLLTASSPRLQHHYPCHHAYRLFASSAQPSIAEVGAATRSNRLVSNDDVHKEEKKRGRLSDVSFQIFTVCMVWFESVVVPVHFCLGEYLI